MINLNNNAAGRLHQIFAKGHLQSRQISQIEAWSNVLDVPAGNNSLLMRRIGHVMELPSLIKEEIIQLENVSHEIFLRWTSSVDDAFTYLNFHNSWDSFINRIGPATMQGIEFCADTLSRFRSEPTIEQDVLSTLLADITEMLTDLEGASIDDDIRVYISSHLVRIRMAIKEYTIHGIKPLKHEVESAFGSILLHHDRFLRTKETKEGSAFWELMSRIALIGAIATNPISLAADIKTFLPNSSLQSATQDSGRINNDPIEPLHHI